MVRAANSNAARTYESDLNCNVPDFTLDLSTCCANHRGWQDTTFTVRELAAVRVANYERPSVKQRKPHSSSYKSYCSTVISATVPKGLNHYPEYGLGSLEIPASQPQINYPDDRKALCEIVRDGELFTEAPKFEFSTINLNLASQTSSALYLIPSSYQGDIHASNRLCRRGLHIADPASTCNASAWTQSRHFSQDLPRPRSMAFAMHQNHRWCHTSTSNAY